MDAINHGAAAINSGITYLQSNAWAILFLIGVGYIVKTKGTPYVFVVFGLHDLVCLSQKRQLCVVVLDVYFAEGPRDTQSRNLSLQEDMRRVRMAQQEAAAERAKEASQLSNVEDREKKLKKNLSVQKKYNSSDAGYGNGGTYNPMNPSASSSRGYRPARKTARRG